MKTLFLVVLGLFFSTSTWACGSWGIDSWCAFTDSSQGTPHKVILAFDYGDGCHSDLMAAYLFISKDNTFPIHWNQDTGRSIDNFDKSKLASIKKLPYLKREIRSVEEFEKEMAADPSFKTKFAATGVDSSKIGDGYTVLKAEGYEEVNFWNKWQGQQYTTESPSGLGGWVTLPDGKNVICEALPQGWP